MKCQSKFDQQSKINSVILKKKTRANMLASSKESEHLSNYRVVKWKNEKNFYSNSILHFIF